MDRNKPASSSRSQKKISGHMGSEFYALGAKGGRDESKSKLSVKGGCTGIDRKRDSSVNLTSTSKKPKLALRLGGETSYNDELWEKMTTDCEPLALVDAVRNAADLNEMESACRILCGSIRHLLESRSKLDIILYLSLLYLAKLRPSLFCYDILTSALISVLKRESNIKVRQGPPIHIFACNLLTKGYYDKHQWPEIFMHIYIEDSINERFWSDIDLCEPFIKNICSVFQTRAPTSTLLQTENLNPAWTTGQQHREATLGIDEDSCDNSVNDLNVIAHVNTYSLDSDTYYSVENRYSDNQLVIEKCVVEAIKEQFNKRQQQETYTRNFLKFLCSTSGLSEVRNLCVTRLELWIHNGKLVRLAQQLLLHICFNVKSTNLRDHDVLVVLVKIRLKTKPLINFYMMCLKEMITQQPDILAILLKLVVQNELSNTRNPNNMGMLATMFQTSSDESAQYLAEIYKEFLLQREDCLRTLRVFMRELVRMLRFDINIVKFCSTFLSERRDFTEQIMRLEYRDRIFYSMVDVITLCMLLSVTTQIREATNARTSRDIKNNAVVMKFYTQMSQIQLDAISWMYETVPNVFKQQSIEYSQALHKILLLDNAEQYSRCDQWPSEPERSTLLRIVGETPIREETLLRIILIGITKNIPVTIPDAIDIIMLVVRKASSVQTNKLDIIDFLFSMVEYHYPENIKLPQNYDPPKLAITVLYWKVWLILLIISSHNPSTFGAFCWEHYPMMKMLIEMCITNQFNEHSMTADELQIISLEREHILQFESYLAAQTSQTVITEENAILISQLILMDPMGPSRRVPTIVLEQLKTLNKTLKLGHLLCRSRKPDLLVDIIQRQGTTQSMPWLSDLVQNSEGDFSHLPVQCLCEFLLFNANAINEENSRDAELVNYLRNHIIQPSSNEKTVCEILDYIFRRLSSTTKQTRTAAIKGLKIIFQCLSAKESEWLLEAIPQISHFKIVCPFIIPQLRAACQVENCPSLVMSYIQFVAAHTINDSVNEMFNHVIDMAQLIVERNTMFQHIIPKANESTLISLNDENLYSSRLKTLKCLFAMFNNYIIKLRANSEIFELIEDTDVLMVQFHDGIQVPLHMNIIHAFVILSGYSNNTMPESMPILDYWFPTGQQIPIAYIPNNPHEPVQLFPDWLKLKMIQSSVDRLVEAALYDLMPDQIVLFVQNFGTPVNSMSKLLALLDHAIIEQFNEVKNAILNKAYLAQLIEIQQSRGAKNGHFTVQALELHSHSQTVPDLPKLKYKSLEIFDIAPIRIIPYKTPISKRLKNIEGVLFGILKDLQIFQLNNSRFRKLIHNILERYDSTSGEQSSYLRRLLGRFKEANYPNNAQIGHVCTFFRLILHNNAIKSEDWKFLLSKIENALPEHLVQPESLIYYTSLQNIFRNVGYFYNKGSCKLSAKRYLQRNCHTTMPPPYLISNLHNLGMECSEEPNSFVNNSLCQNGLLVDWLSEFDPELTNMDNKVESQLLFSKTSKDFRFYLLSLICHQTNWNTLISKLKFSLNTHRSSVDCSVILNFINAIINIPKLWQGRDKSIARANISERMLLFKSNDLTAITELILSEGESAIEASVDNYEINICTRINLLFRITNKKSSDLVKFIEYVFKGSCLNTLKQKVLQQIYLMHPSIRFIRSNFKGKHAMKLGNLKGCEADKVSNYLITCLGNLRAKKDFETLSSDTEILLRKLAASHPALFLRQLGVLVSFVQGRAQISSRALRDEYHLQRFIQILRTLELLQPMIFDDNYKQDFQSVLESYFIFFKHHSYIKETYHIILTFVEFLQAYINTNPASALTFIEQYVYILMELSFKFSSISSLHQLIQGISILQRRNTVSSNEVNKSECKQDVDIDEQNEVGLAGNACTDGDSTDNTKTKETISFPIVGYSLKSTALSPHFLGLIKIIKESSSEDIILGPLQEIECITSKRFSFFDELFDRLLELIFSPSAQIRLNAFILLIRHLKYNPGRADVNRCTLNAYIQCLRDDNSSVAATAMDNLVEMTLLLQEHASEILAVAFSLGIRSHFYTCTHIKRVLQILMLEHGY